MSTIVPRCEPARLLIIDDEETIAHMLARALRLEGYDVWTALDATSGLQMLDACHPQAIIVDLRMPLINGVGFLYRLRDLPGHQRTPVAILTGDHRLDAALVREIDQLGARLHFKPIQLKALLEMTRSLSHPAIVERGATVMREIDCD